MAAHGMELHFVFGSLDIPKPGKPALAAIPIPAQNPRFRKFQMLIEKSPKTMMTIWTQFARTGNPSVKGLVEWPAWDKASDQYLYITEPLQVKSGYSDLAKIKPIRTGKSL